MTPQEAVDTTYWDRVAAKAGTRQQVMAYASDKRVMVRHGARRRGFDPARAGWISDVIAWLEEGRNG